MKTLNLSGNGSIGCGSFADFAKMLEFTSLKELDLSQNYISDEDGILIANSIA